MGDSPAPPAREKIKKTIKLIKYEQNVKGEAVNDEFWVFFTLVFGCMMVTPCLLMAIRTMSGKFGSDVCLKKKVIKAS